MLVTGAAGFVGRTLCRTLAERGYLVRAAVRRPEDSVPGAMEIVTVPDLAEHREWSVLLDGVEFVIHAAARAHVWAPHRTDSPLYFQANTLASERLAWAAADGGVRRLLFLSSIKVNGEQTDGRAYRATDAPQPQDAYALSKWLAEQALLRVASRTRMEVVTIRPPLVYGPGVRGNFLRLMRMIEAGWPLPLGSVRNMRSLVSLWNLCDLLLLLLESREAPGRVWMASDGEDLSTPELIRRLGRAMGRRPRLLRAPPGLLRACGAALGRNMDFARLCGSLTVDAADTCRKLGWQAPMTVNEGLEQTARWYLEESRRSAA